MHNLLNDARCDWFLNTVEWITYEDNIAVAVKGKTAPNWRVSSFSGSNASLKIFGLMPMLFCIL